MIKQKQQLDLTPYHTLGFPLLGLMALIGLAGIVLAVIVALVF